MPAYDLSPAHEEARSRGADWATSIHVSCELEWRWTRDAFRPRAAHNKLQREDVQRTAHIQPVGPKAPRKACKSRLTGDRSLPGEACPMKLISANRAPFPGSPSARSFWMMATPRSSLKLPGRCAAPKTPADQYGSTSIPISRL